MNIFYTYIIIICCLIIIKIKKINIVFRTLNTFFHEISHGIVASILKSDVKNINLNNNASGHCASVSKNHIANFFIFLAGYTSCAFIPYVLFFAVNKNFTFFTICIIIIISILALAFWIKNKFGRIWTFVFIALNIAFLFVPYLIIFQKYLIVLYAALIALDNFFSCLTLIKCAWKNSKSAGDASLLQKTTKIPAMFWSLLFLAISVFFIYKIYIDFIPLCK
ncbi:MAG: M50 family metallopeptidase [Bacteroidales bacterium]|jgi:hypothetical protein|nr:M50 family metallopeptidase [Bacteroidales bacterium]